MRKVEFIQDFATKKKGDILNCDGQLASHLVHQDKVAKYVDLSKEPEVKEKPIKKAKKK